MHGEGRQLLRQHIKIKRANEGLEEIPTDLFAKKPRFEMTDEEHQSMQDRRQRNKEAAERSRKKKKSEFEKLQIENDQLNQDKCELVAMLNKLKNDVSQITMESDGLRATNEQLMRWIGKRSAELGLMKYKGKNAPNKGDPAEVDTASASLTRGNPLLNTGIVNDNKMLESTPLSDSPKPHGIISNKKAYSVSPSTSPKPHSPSPPVFHQQPASHGLQLQTPWLVEKPAAPERNDSLSPATLTSSSATLNTSSSAMLNTSSSATLNTSSSAMLNTSSFAMLNTSSSAMLNTSSSGGPVVLAQPQKSQPMVVASSQQVVYVPKDAIILIQESNPALVVGSCAPPGQVLMVSPEIVAEPAEMHSAEQPKISSGVAMDSTAMDSSSTASPVGCAGTSLAVYGPCNDDRTRETGDGEDATATAIESLLKLGFKISPPEASLPPEAAPLQSVVTSLDGDHSSFEAPAIFTVPVNASDSVTDVVVTTSSEGQPINSWTTAPNPLMNCRLQLKGAGHTIHNVLARSIMEA